MAKVITETVPTFHVTLSADEAAALLLILRHAIGDGDLRRLDLLGLENALYIEGGDLGKYLDLITEHDIIPLSLDGDR
jgi:hypothetical protein